MAFLRALTAMALGGLLAGCTDRSRAPGGWSGDTCTLPGITREAECGVVVVPESPGGAATLPLRIVRVRARRPGPAREALVLLAGGPGQAATEAFGRLWPLYESIAEGRDVLLFDARGTGASAPLDCERDDDLTATFAAGSLARAAKRCAPRSAGRSLELFGTDAHVADLERVRHVMGYERLELLGVSYGTRVALGYARRFPSRVRALVLDGVAPPSLVLGATFGRDADAALDAVFGDCEADATCRVAFPDGRGALERRLSALDAAPAEVVVRHPDTDAPLTLRVERAGLAAALRGLLYAPELAALIPYLLAEVEAGRYQALFGQTVTLGRGAEESMSLGLLFSVACAEDVPRIDDAAREAERKSRLGAALVDDFRQACAAWPVRARPLPTTREPLAVPTLLLSGAADPATPPRFAEALAAELSSSTHVVVPQAGHGVWARGCVPRLVADFLERGAADGLDVGCVARYRRPEFFLDRGGPAP